MTDVLENFMDARKALYKHVGFVEDWVICPIEDSTNYVWSVDDTEIKYADSKEDYYSDGNFYTAAIYTQRFYKKWVYRGEKYTMIFGHPGVDGMNWFYIFDNNKEIK